MTAAEVFGIGILHGYIPQILIAEAMFMSKLRRRKRFWLRLAVGLPVTVLLMIVIPNMIAKVTSGLFSLNIFLLSIALCAVLFENHFSDVVFCAVGAQLTQNLSYNVENLIYLPFAESICDAGWLCISVGSMLAVYAVSYFAFVRRMNPKGELYVGGKFVFPIAVSAALFVYLMQYLFQIYGIDRMWVTRLPLIVCCVFGLIMQFGILMYGSERNENEQLEYFLRQERKQYEATKNSIDLINMKAHDLKHHIRRVQSMSGYDKEELEEIAGVVENYESTVDCGNKTLDVILTEKQYRCQSEGIELSLIVQGEELSFVHTSDLVSVFGNALDNAIECELRTDEKEKRCIAVRVVRKGGMVSVHFENYCKEEPVFENGVLKTSKPDKGMHGFGMKSIRYAVSKYGGTVYAGKDGNLFVLDILLPVPENAKKEETK